MVLAGLDRAEPHRIVPPRHHVHLHPERRHVKIVDHVLAAHDQLYVAVHRDVQLVDLFPSVRLLQLPHPLLPNEIYVQRILRRDPVIHVNRRAPSENPDSNDRRNQRPADFQHVVSVHVVADLVRALTPELERREYNQHRHQHREKQRGHQDEREQRIDVAREIGRLVWKCWKR